MIPRYSRPEMARIWSQEAKYEAWLRVELAVCEVYGRRGVIPVDALGRIKAKAAVNAHRIDEIEATTRHDVIAFLTNLEEALGADSRHVHIGLTSSDVVDTAQALQLQQAAELLLAGLERFRGALKALALAHKDTLCVGRTHGIHAEPMTFGLKPAVWYLEAGRNLERLKRAREAVRVGKISGAVGTFAHVDPDVEEEVCRLLGLEPARIRIRGREDRRCHQQSRPRSDAIDVDGQLVDRRDDDTERECVQEVPPVEPDRLGDELADRPFRRRQWGRQRPLFPLRSPRHGRRGY